VPKDIGLGLGDWNIYCLGEGGEHRCVVRGRVVVVVVVVEEEVRDFVTGLHGYWGRRVEYYV
jgi:hypothetical protein